MADASPGERFARRMFRGAAIYGVIVLAPLYLLPPPPIGAENFYGFIGCALVFQWVFWIIGGDPVRYRSLMIPAVAEKWVFAAPALVLIALGRTPVAIAPFALIDLLLSVGFIQALRSTSVS